MAEALRQAFRMAVHWNGAPSWNWVGPIYFSKASFEQAWNANAEQEGRPTGEDGTYSYCVTLVLPGLAPDDPAVWRGHADHLTVAVFGVPHGQGARNGLHA